MKKLPLLTVLLFLSTLSHAQILVSLIFGDKLNNDDMEFGLAMGLNSSRISQSVNTASLNNFTLGMYMDFSFSEKFTLVAGMNAIDKRGISELDRSELLNSFNDSLFHNADNSRIIHYYSFPVAIRYNFTPAVGVFAGMNLGIRYRAEDVSTARVDDITFVRTAKIGRSINNLDYGPMFGFGYHFKGDPGAQLRLQYYIGLHNVYQNSATKHYNRLLQVQVIFPIKMSL